jgi:hypothetical protein
VYGFLAEVVMLLHFGFILFVVFGGLLTLRWRRFALLHLPTVLWALFLELKPGTYCPLTPLEQELRHKAQEPSYTGGFIEHYLDPLIYPNISTHHQYLLGLLLFLFTAVVYLGVYRRWQTELRDK